MPVAYMKDLFQGKRPGPLESYRSREFDFSEVEGRRESFRVTMKFLRHLLELRFGSTRLGQLCYALGTFGCTRSYGVRSRQRDV